MSIHIHGAIVPHGIRAYTPISYTLPTPTPANFGDALDGGYYAGMIWNQVAQCNESHTLAASGSKTFTLVSSLLSVSGYPGQLVEIRSRSTGNKFAGAITSLSGDKITINISNSSGSGTFNDWSVMCRFRIVVAPKATGENLSVIIKSTNTALPTACQTLSEGWVSTEAMRTSGNSSIYPAAHWARNLSINGYTDWYIPARDELALCWRNLKPITNNNYVGNDRPVSAYNYAKLGAINDTSVGQGYIANSAPSYPQYTATVPQQTASTIFRSGQSQAFNSVRYASSSDFNNTYIWVQNWEGSYPGRQWSYDKTASAVRAVRRSII